jgi:hypothetical protein
MKKRYFFASFLCWVLTFSIEVFGQNVSTEGKDFWLGFMENHETSQIDLEIFISSTDTTEGIVEMPYYNWSETFYAYPGITAKITVPVNLAMNRGSGTITNKGIHISADDNVSVYALNKRRLSSDATVVLPSISLGKEYYAMAHMEPDGGGPSLFSEILLVAISDQTELEITPAVITTDGHLQDLPYNITLDKGQTYQLQSNGQE